MPASTTGWIGAALPVDAVPITGWVALVSATLIFLVGVLEDLVFVDLDVVLFEALLPMLSEPVVNGSVIIFELLGVGLDVQFHEPLASAHDWPSLAVP